MLVPDEILYIDILRGALSLNLLLKDHFAKGLQQPVNGSFLTDPTCWDGVWIKDLRWTGECSQRTLPDLITVLQATDGGADIVIRWMSGKTVGWRVISGSISVHLVERILLNPREATYDRKPY